MTTAEQTHHCEIELELSKRDFHEDLSRIGEKLHETRVHLNPMHIIEEKSLLISGVGLVAGFVLGNWNPIRRFTQATYNNQ